MGGGMFSLKLDADFPKTTSFLERLKDAIRLNILNKYGAMGVEALSSATPVDTGLTANSWSYEVEMRDGGASIIWSNSNVSKGWFHIAIALQYGHGTGTGGYVQGRDYINPAMQPVFDKFAHDAWMEVLRV